MVDAAHIFNMNDLNFIRFFFSFRSRKYRKRSKTFDGNFKHENTLSNHVIQKVTMEKCNESHFQLTLTLDN